MTSAARARLQEALAVRRDYLPFGRPDFSAAEIDAVTRVLRSGWIGMGGEVIAFEQELGAAIEGATVVTVNSCTSALFLALLAHGIGPGDEVITPSLTWCATANAALYAGARPVFCDIDPDSLCVTPKSVLRRLTAKTRAVVVVHYGGLAIDVKALRAVLPPRVAIVEDAAHAWGARYPDGKPVGSSGNLTCFSFYANKNLSTGEGGAIALFDAAIAERLRVLRQSGVAADAWKRFTHKESLWTPEVGELGYKMNYTDLQACIGRVQLARQPELAARRRAVALCYRDGLRDLGSSVAPQRAVHEDGHARHLYVVKLDTARLGRARNDILLELRERNVGAAIHYRPLHTMSFYRRFDDVKLEATERTFERILTLPISGSMSTEDAAYAAEHLRDVIGA